MNFNLTRRTFLQSALAGTALAASPSWLSAAPLAALRDAAGRKGIAFGAWPGQELQNVLARTPKEYSELFLSQCALYAVNLSWKWIDGGRRGAYDYSEKAPAIDLALSRKLMLTGYHLLWHENIPGWWAALDNTEAKKSLREHILFMGKTFGGGTWSWNAVNEAIDPDSPRADGLRESPFLTRFGPGFIADAFHQAREAAPTALRVYNDYDFERDNKSHEKRRRALLALVDGLLKEGVPIDGVGLQSHLVSSPDFMDEKIYRAFLKELAARNLKIFITELDVMDVDLPGDITARDRGVADIYRRFLDVALDEAAVRSVVLWGLSDRYTWLQASSGRRFARADGLPERPHAFDENFQPKPAYAAIMRAFDQAPARS